MRSPQTLGVAFPSFVPAHLTGYLELKLDQILASSLSRPEKVSEILACVFAKIGGETATLTLARHLATGAREWLLQKAGCLYSRDSGWYEASCTQCSQTYDVTLSLEYAPRSSAGKGFPIVEVQTSLGLRRFEVPNGSDEELLARSNADSPQRYLLGICGLDVDANEDATVFSDDDIVLIDERLDAIAPDVASEFVTTCPSCNTQTMAMVDPLEFAFPASTQLFSDTHLIAKAYGWNEATVFSLNSARRRKYATLIAADRVGGRPVR